MIKGLRTVIYPVTDMNAAKSFYRGVSGKDPYFDEPFYIGFEVGGFELGLIPDGTPGPGGSVAYWGVENIVAEVARLQKLGATIREEVKDVGEGIRVATLADPFGNSIGLIENPHFSIAKVQ